MYSFSKCLAHPPDDYLIGHLLSVAQANRCLWGSVSGLFGHASVLAGLLHDVGKANRWFQDRMYGNTDRKTPYSNHSLPSAMIGWYVASHASLAGKDLNRFKLSVFTAILRHHSDLQQPWEQEIVILKQRINSADERHEILLAQLNSMDLPGIEEWLKTIFTNLCLPVATPELKPELIMQSIVEARPLRLTNSFKDLECFIGFLGAYSGLLHFDKIHSARGSVERTRFDLPDNAVPTYIEKTISKQPGQLTEIRENVSMELERELVAHADEHFYTVTAPTGSGKTLAALNAVLKLRKHLLVREGIELTIIYCLPFTSIIEQNHAVYRNVLEASGLTVNSEILLKHHHLSYPIYSSSDPEFDPDDSELFTESWQSEIIVTTFHQLLNSIITNRNRHLKRFVVLKNSIVIMDEVQSVPRKYWDAVRRLFEIIGKTFNTRFILMTATQPLLFREDMARELLPDHERYFRQLSRIKLINKTTNETTLDDFFEKVASEAEQSHHQSRMCILNRKGSATFDKLYKLFRKRLGDRPIYALSTRLTPKDRRARIEEIRTRLEGKQPCFIITTQLVEAGVDISVDVIDRDMAPLDSIIQSAGRCNRHGENTAGVVNLWLLTDGRQKMWQRVYDPFLIDATQNVLQGLDIIEERDFLGLGKRYFNIVYNYSEPKDVDMVLQEGRFLEIEGQFKLIDDEGPMQSYFIIQTDEDRTVWEQYSRLCEIDDHIERKKQFNRLKSDFMDRIIQTRTNEPSTVVLPLEATLNTYDPELGFMGEPASVIL
ncbi:MAG: hypothetical protein A2W23_01560 [Planctomycetes bacterium RBG_16_43_13]|nr:MAG: hypothetical protein A2W23_01560 [Planctomycetes bacterium RBG_16_43_13]